MFDRLGAALRRCWLIWVLIVTLTPAGCTFDFLDRLRGPGFDDDSKRLTSELPQRKREGKPFSFSTKGREIEKNFGFE